MTELYHHGIIGQKWGVRRYQNKDGTLTEAGKRRLNRVSKVSNAAVSAKNRYDKVRKNTTTYKASTMSDVELKKAIDRMELEKKYKDLSRSDITKGQNFIENLLIIAGTAATTSFITNLAKDAGKAASVAAVSSMISPKIAKIVWPKK